jgi:hypothetical protein
MNCADGNDYGNVADLQVPDPVLYGDGQHIVLIGGLFRAPGQDVDCAGVLGVVERDDVRVLVTIADGTYK